MKKIMVLTTPEEIAEGIELFMAKRKATKNEPSFKKEKMTVAEACQFIEVSYPTLCKWINEKKYRFMGKDAKDLY